ncbi:MAG: MFS transporter, partial [Kiloniellales bacterium]|nr:MFS transporter [Kiloniellales bacterium]
MPQRPPFLLKRLSSPGSEAFAILFGFESLSRALLVTVLPLHALEITGSAQSVSLVFFWASLVGLLGGFLVPLLVEVTARRWVYSASILLLAGSALALASHDPQIFMAGMIARALCVSGMTICLSLYIMDFVARTELTKAEPMRMLYSAGAWSLGPFIGVYLWNEVNHHWPYVISALSALATLFYFWVLRITDNPSVTQRARPVPSPWRYVRSYFGQPRLTLSWIIATGRNVWWVIFFVYVPIFAVETGLGEIVGAAIVSIGSAFLFLVTFLAKLIRFWGLRRVLFVNFAIAAAATLAVSFLWDWPWIAAAALLIAALSMIAIDAAGNTLFMFAVKPRERAEMTTVYSTYRGVADIIPPGVFAVVLGVFSLPAVFVLGAASVAGLAVLSRRIHPRLGRDRRD